MTIDKGRKMQNMFGETKQEKTINNDYEKFILNGQSENALNAFVKGLGLNKPTNKEYIKCHCK